MHSNPGSQRRHGYIHSYPVEGMRHSRGRWLLSVAIGSLLPPIHTLELDEVDHSASWRGAGLGDHFAAVHDEALPEPLLAALQSDAESLLQKRSTPDQKRAQENSFWVPLYKAHGGSRRKPLSAIEAAAHHLHRLVFGDAQTPVVGGEWWLRGEDGPVANQGLGFHFDKDESAQVSRDVMRFPEISTVTYLSSVGAPTLILNQTIGLGADEMEPRLARNGLLVHPKVNRHVVFRGEFHHGVVGKLAGGAATGRRVVLLINWWRAPAPTEPWCLPMGAGGWQRQGLLWHQPPAAADPATARRASVSASASVVVEPQRAPSVAAGRRADGDLHGDGYTWVSFDVGDGYVYQYPFPRSESVASDSALVEWQPGAAVGPLMQLSREGMPAIEGDERPKLHLVLPGRQPDLWAGVLPHWLPAVHGAYARSFAFVLTDPSEHPGFLRMFGLRGGQAPTAVIYDTRAPPRGAKFALGGDLEEAALVAFLDGFLRGKLQPMKEEL